MKKKISLRQSRLLDTAVFFIGLSLLVAILAGLVMYVFVTHAVNEKLAIVCAICLGVGLSREYGTAQRMYVKRGYIPDGSGVWYQDKQCVQYETVCTVDDDLVLFLSKKLRG